MITDSTNPIRRLEGFCMRLKASDTTYNIAIEDNPMLQSISHVATTPTTANATRFTTLQDQERIAYATHSTTMQALEAPKIFCDA
jgi:hypothetical protein